MPRTVLKGLDHKDALARIRGWTRARFSLPADAMILVSERACAIPGGPPVETLVGFWTGAETRHHFRIFKPALEIAPDDLPFAWLKDALAAAPDWQCECC
jgi:nitrate reductase delta subunit